MPGGSGSINEYEKKRLRGLFPEDEETEEERKARLRRELAYDESSPETKRTLDELRRKKRR